MKFVVYDWAYEAKGAMAGIGLDHQQVLGEDGPDQELLWETAKRAFKAGLSVKVSHPREPGLTVLCLDTRDFSQR